DADATSALFAADASYDRPGYPTMVGQQITDFYHGERVIDSGAHSLEARSPSTRISCRECSTAASRTGPRPRWDSPTSSSSTPRGSSPNAPPTSTKRPSEPSRSSPAAQI